MTAKLAAASVALLVLGACQGIAPKSPETVCEEAGNAPGTEAHQACVVEQDRIAAEQRRVYFRRTHRGPGGR